MIVAIAGGHGQIALLLEKELTARGHEAIALVRNPDHVPDVEKHGARAEVVDLEHTTVEALSAAIAGADAVVFAAGAGPDSGATRKESVDRGAAVLLADAAVAAEVGRYVMVSSMGADSGDPDSDDVFQVYLRAKGAADADLRARTELDWTILRPGRLTDDEATDRVALAPAVERGAVPRADVASVLAELLATGAGSGLVLELVSGHVPIAEAVAALPTDPA
ncbi:NAD(P)-binding oxidoreductase [Pedococcus soli]